MNLSNAEQTFVQIVDFTFVPVSCHYVIVNNQNQTSVRNDYTKTQSSEDISFSLNVVQTGTFCSSITFFNQLSEDIEVTIVPPLKDKPNITLEMS